MTYTLRDEVTDIVSKYYHDDLSRESSVDRILAIFAEERAELEENLRSHAYKRDIALERAEKAEAREVALREALETLTDGLDANTDGRDGLSNEQWERAVALARAALAPEEEK